MKNYVEQISAGNFQGRTFSYPLRPITILHGENSIGKTATTNAIRILLLGYSPQHGKASAKTFGFAGSINGASSFNVKGVVAGKSVERAWEFKKKKITSSGFEGEIVPPVLLDANEWLKLSGPQKTNFVFNLIDLSTLGYSTEQIAARLKADVKVETPDEASERIIGEAVQAVYDLADHRDHEGQTYQEWIAAVVAHYEKQQDDTKVIIDDMAGTISGTTQLQAQDGLKPIQNIADEMSAARTALQTATTDFQLLERAKDYQVSKATRKTSLTNRLANMIDRSDYIATSEKECAELNRGIQDYKSKTLSLVQRLTTAQAEQAQSKKSADIRTAQVAFLKTKLAEDLKADSCPHCKSKGKGWKKALTESVDEQIAGIEKDAKEFMAEHDAKKIIVEQLSAEVEQSKASDAAIEKVRVEIMGMRGRIRALTTEQNEYTTAKARIEEIGDVGNPVDDARIQAAQKIVTLARTEVERLEGVERQQIAAMQDSKRQEQARQAHTEKKIEHEIYKLALKTMKALQSEMMESAFGKFMEKMNLIADGIFPGGKLVFHDGEIGYWHGATFVSMDYFGGTEQMLAFAGLSLTLAQSATMKIILLDEMGRMSLDRREKTARRMLELVAAGVIDQCIMVDPTSTAYENIEGVHLIEIK